MPTSSEATMVASPSDRAVLTDPKMRYRPTHVRGGRYTVRVDPPEPRPAPDK